MKQNKDSKFAPPLAAYLLTVDLDGTTATAPTGGHTGTSLLLVRPDDASAIAGALGSESQAQAQVRTIKDRGVRLTVLQVIFGRYELRIVARSEFRGLSEWLERVRAAGSVGVAMICTSPRAAVVRRVPCALQTISQRATPAGDTHQKLEHVLIRAAREVRAARRVFEAPALPGTPKQSDVVLAAVLLDTLEPEWSRRASAAPRGGLNH